MVGFFSLLTLICLVCSFIGLVNPKLVIRWGDLEKRTTKKVLKYYGTGFIIFFILFGITADMAASEEDKLRPPESSIEQVLTEDEKVAIELDKEIVALGNVEAVTLSSVEDVENVRNTYESLTLDQRVLVTKLSVLTEMEKTLSELQEEKDINAKEEAQALEQEVQVQNSVATAQVQTQAPAQVSEPTPAEVQNNEYIVYITKTGSKYHRDGCRYLSQSQISISEDDAINQGYTPCSVCNP